MADTGTVRVDCGGLTGIHIFALNLIAPQIVGRKVRLNAVAITIALLFWGWCGRHGAGAGDSDYGNLARDLRSHRIVETDWKMAERIALRYQPGVYPNN